MDQKVALITGIGGQDGSYLAEFLLEKGYKVRGIIRRSSLPNTDRIEHLIKKYQNFKASNEDDIPFLVKYADLMDGNSLREIIEKFKPDEIYNLGAQSHVGISFQTPESTIQFNTLGPLRILEAIRQSKLKCKYYQASSSEMFGISPPPQSEDTPMLPQSPYGISKLAAYHLTRLYRNAYGLFACSGILFNHESPRRGHNFVTKKITQELARIIVGEIEKISLGNLDAKRDWGFSKEYIRAMWEILQQPEPEDYVISTDETHTVREFLQEVFSTVGLNYEDFLETSDIHKRPAEVPALLGDSSKAKKVLGWDPKVKFKELVKMMVVSDIKKKLEETGNVSITSDSEKSEDYYIEKAKEVFAKVQASKNN
ncbi:GDP-mannose 4,6-dehydratase [Candidatus Pacearchaeota archaeon]|nr:GDP-mannose 4,6-dehydratase [Candidatus Pacearchaeota archaeon]